ncbi:MAG: hypothetical protein R3213_09350 [Flavobacteriaceae bacterium]|nr:hypothetical protein [Flavobacteriaceae bacterium]
MDQRPMPQEERSHYCIPVKHLNNLLNMWDDNKLILKDENDEDWNSLVEAMTDIGGILDEK